MRDYIGPHEVLSTDDFLELAIGIGTPLELWLGEDDETSEQRAGREAAARDIIADDPALIDRVTALSADVIGRTMPELLNLVPAPRPAAPVRRRSCGKERAA
ncbi:hypothetical protein [Actinacidiphila sp. ITFR-21]|uniref:hypothetical protein n=1 Tax=Actinacidiphila sp. ITFR-21 TaxID=3075199 RepID=UPI00288AE21A|nr:hypothetical protein [Streptomyces sp. ITFR-21]WNI16222.1 hypothetical protein RLT57_12235 [Streptomyces sp. ITFR-21]